MNETPIFAGILLIGLALWPLSFLSVTPAHLRGPKNWRRMDREIKKMMQAQFPGGEE